MTKQEFLTQRQAQRETGQLQEVETLPQPVNELTESEEEKIIQALGNQKAGVYKTASIGLKGLLRSIEYTGKTVTAVRNIVDELDNVTVQKVTK